MGPEAAAAAQTFISTYGPAIAAAGTAASMAAEQEKANQQRSILNKAFERSQKSQDEGAKQVLSEASKAAPGNQSQAIQQAQNSAYTRTMSDLKGAGAGIIDTAGGQGVVSDAFARAKADRTGTEGDRMSAIAREAAGVRAPSITGADNAMSRSALAERIGSMASDNRNRAQAAQLDAQSVHAPWYGDVGKIASLVGTIGMMNPSAAAATEGYTLGPATLGDAGTAGSTEFGAVKFGDGASRTVTLGGGGAAAAPAASGQMSLMAQALPGAATLARRRTQPMWMGR